MSDPDGKIAAWTSADTRSLGRQPCCACGEWIVVGELAQERPGLSLCFYHTEPKECAALREVEPTDK